MQWQSIVVASLINVVLHASLCCCHRQNTYVLEAALFNDKKCCCIAIGPMQLGAGIQDT